jgi:cardiolipin synthase
MRHLPNLLSFIRILLTPVVVAAVLRGRCDVALPVVVFAGLTDAADGFLARRLRAESRLGASVDPVADKLLLVSLYVAFGISGLIPEWLVWLVVGRDVTILAMVAAGFFLTNARNFPPTIWGKVSTVVQIAGAVAILSGCSLLADQAPVLRDITVWLVAAATLQSGMHYIWRGFQMYRNSRVNV